MILTFVSGDNREIELLNEECSYYDQNLTITNPGDADSRRIKGRTRFAFINKYGVMDYYNVNNPVKKSSKITRKDYTQPQLPWQTLNTSSGAIFDANKRGKDTYSTTYTDQFEVTTDYLDQELSDWLTELIESPSVFIQNETLSNLADIESDNFIVNFLLHQVDLPQYELKTLVTLGEPINGVKRYSNTILSGNLVT
jgi:hypothetical protein